MKSNVIVVGSYNADLTIKTARIPSPGETVIGATFSSGGGGKGANQAVAAARAGADVALVARVGDDTFGREGISRLRREGIDTRRVTIDTEVPTGVAFIVVDEHGENSIVVASGANARLSSADIGAASPELSTARVLLVQLETPLSAVQEAIRHARRGGGIVMLNPAPAIPLDGGILRDVDIITPNRFEAQVLTGIRALDPASLRAIAGRFFEFGVGAVLVTLGAEGVFMATTGAMEFIPSYAVQSVDSTGAGDVFSGSLAAFIAEGMSMEESVRRAVASASLSVTRLGALEAAPRRAEIDAFLASHHPSASVTPGG